MAVRLDELDPDERARILAGVSETVTADAEQLRHARARLALLRALHGPAPVPPSRPRLRPVGAWIRGHAAPAADRAGGLLDRAASAVLDGPVVRFAHLSDRLDRVADRLDPHPVRQTFTPVGLAPLFPLYFAAKANVERARHAVRDHGPEACPHPIESRIARGLGSFQRCGVCGNPVPPC